MRGVSRGIRITLAFCLAVASPVSGQSVADIVDQMLEAVERHARGVDDYTLVQSVMGFETTTYFEKEMVDGRPVFRTRQTVAGGFSMGLGGDDVGFGDVSAFGQDLVEHGRYVGREEVDGRSVHVIAIDDVTELDLTGPSGPDDMDFVPTSAAIYVDAEQYMARRLTFRGKATTDSGVHDVTTVVDMMDYRDVDGLLIPYQTVVSIEGIGAMIDPEMQAQLDDMMERLEEMDPQQRAMMERMLGPQMEQMREMMGGDGGPMTIEMTVTEVRVNAGPPRQ